MPYPYSSENGTRDLLAGITRNQAARPGKRLESPSTELTCRPSRDPGA